jgi:threonine dehydratase
MDEPELSLDLIRVARQRLGSLVVETPVWQWRRREAEDLFGPATEVFLKLELLQYTGSFKPRGALTNLLDLAADSLTRGVTTVSAGNHAMAVAYGARVLGTSAKVVMPRTAQPVRVQGCRDYGAEVVLAADVHEAIALSQRIASEEGRAFVHAFDGPRTALGTATLGFEFCNQVPDLDAVIVAIGGGGLCAGVSQAVRLIQPRCTIFGVEPEGAAAMSHSFASGKPEKLVQARTIADTLAAPYVGEYAFRLCRRNVERVVLVDDESMCAAMATLFQGAKLAVEPAGAAALAALAGPLKNDLTGKRVGVIVCGSNLDVKTFEKLVSSAPSRNPAADRAPTLDPGP